MSRADPQVSPDGHACRQAERGGRTGSTRLLGVAFGAGVLVGAALDLLTYVVARHGPSGSDGASWSFRGNGALVVPFGLGPAVVAGAWTALVLHYRSSARWLALGIGAGLVGAAFVVAGIAGVILFGSAAFRVSEGTSVILLVWILVAPLLAGMLGGAGSPSRRTRAVHVIAGVLFPVAIGAGYIVAAVVLPPGS